jgi:hypothetical protein
MINAHGVNLLYQLPGEGDLQNLAFTALILSFRKAQNVHFDAFVRSVPCYADRTINFFAERASKGGS